MTVNNLPAVITIHCLCVQMQFLVLFISSYFYIHGTRGQYHVHSCISYTHIHIFIHFIHTYIPTFIHSSKCRKSFKLLSMSVICEYIDNLLFVVFMFQLHIFLYTFILSLIYSLFHLSYRRTLLYISNFPLCIVYPSMCFFFHFCDVTWFATIL